MTNEQLRFALLRADAYEPTRGHFDDAGFDLYTVEDRTVGPGQFIDVPCGVAVQLPPSTWGMLTGRSSTLRKHGLMVHTGVIDEGYRGELFAGVFNLTDGPVQIRRGERLSQLIVIPRMQLDLTRVDITDQFIQSSRGARGFGSTGR